MYVTLIPLICTGIFNMIFCKMNVCKRLSVPIDGGKCLKDGKRIFGDNKTIKGFIGYIVIGCICNVIWGIICGNIEVLEQFNYLYYKYENTVVYNVIMGLLIGLAYAAFELPNSFIKRRLGIGAGSSLENKSALKYVFMIIDQCDSIIGCVLVVWAVYPLGILNYILYVFLGLITHMAFNILLYALKIRKTII
ncbi:MAG: CDP-archaeol synthase [Lachnospiraceae bacterium]|nr:CDP-archaeol synthase [Lachnospiraceae bacterium]